MTMRVRNVILITAAALCCVSLGWSILSVSAQMQLRCGPAGRYDLLDLLINWACVQNFLLGADPYSINDLHHRLALAGCDYRYSPGVFLVPWSLPVLSLVYQFSFPYAATLWLLLMIACAVASAALTWRIFSKQPVRLPLLALVLCSFFPLWSVLRWGHVGPLLALGTIAAVHFARKKQYFLAGFAAVLLTFKAHVVYLVLAAFALHTLFSRNWRSAAAFAGALCALVLTAHYVSPLAFPSWYSSVHSSAGAQISATLAGIIRYTVFAATGSLHTWPLWLIPGITLAIFAAVAVQRTPKILAVENLPPALCLSVLTAPYCWSHDFVILLIVQTALVSRSTAAAVPVRNRLKILFAVLGINAACFILNLSTPLSQHHLAWYPLAMLAVWYWGKRLTA